MINHAEATQENRLVKEIADLRREIEAMKAKQLLGADNMNVVASSEGSIATLYTPGMVGGLVFNIYAEVKKIYLSEVRVTFFLDNDNDDRYAWPYGANITPSMFQASQFYDWNRSDETGAGNKTYAYSMKNTDTVNHMVYMHLQIIYPAQALVV